MDRIPTAPVVAGSLVAGYLVARRTGIRPLGGAVLAAGGVWATRSWVRSSGPATAGVLLGTYLVGFGASHPLAKRIGAWPAVLVAAGVSGSASYLLADRRA